MYRLEPILDPITIVVGGCSVLGTVVAFLFKLIMSLNKESTEMSRRVGRLEGESGGVKDMAKSTLEVVRDSITERENSRKIKEKIDKLTETDSQADDPTQ